MKSIQVRMLWSTHDFKGDSKQCINKAINKVKLAIDDVCNLTDNQEVIRTIKQELEKADLVYYMTLTEQLFDLPAEDLQEVTDLIDDYLKKKYNM